MWKVMKHAYQNKILQRYILLWRMQLNKRFMCNSRNDGADEDLMSDNGMKRLEPAINKYLSPEFGHRVFILQPDLKRVRKSSMLLSTVEHQLDESRALVECLPNWQVVGSVIKVIHSRTSKELFGSGSLAEVKRLVRQQHGVSAVFFNITTLSASQLSTLQTAFKLPVYDRYTIVLQIFKLRAQTREAKLQVALAELPYYWSRMRGIVFGELFEQRDESSLFGGSGSTALETRRRVLGERERKIHKSLEKIKNNRELLRQGRRRNDWPVIAVVGYTNAGKTSLIKALTADVKLEPRDQLFATLDVTTHAGLLKNRMKVLYVDTVGFISEIPTGLIASFSATLEDVLSANVIVHVRDISHPDREAQKHNVLQTLQKLKLPEHLHNNIIEVANKFDKLTQQGIDDLNCNSSVAISATTGLGLDVLLERIQQCVIECKDMLCKTFRVPLSGQHLSWLYKQATVKDTRCCERDPEFLLVDVVMTQAAYAKFIHSFGTPIKKKRD